MEGGGREVKGVRGRMRVEWRGGTSREEGKEGRREGWKERGREKREGRDRKGGKG